MGSYLAEVLSSVEKMEVEQINAKSVEVATSVETSKTEVLSYLENVYVRFLERPRQNKNLANKIKRLQEDTTTLITNVEDITRKELTKAEADLHKHLEVLGRVNVAISAVHVVYEFHEALLKIKELEDERAFVACMTEILRIEEKFEGLVMGENLDVLDSLKANFATRKGSVLVKMSHVFADHVVMKSEDKKSVFKVKISNEMKEVLAALFLYKTCVTPLDKVTRFLWNSVFVPVVDCTTQIITSSDSFSVLEVVTVDADHKSSYSEVFKNLKIVLEFLSKKFDLPLNEELTTLGYIGRDIRDNLSELIIKHCLQDTIPSTNEGLQAYNVVIKATDDLEKVLVESRIFAQDTTSILDYANNIDVLFINKKCQDYTNAAQEFMKKDLHDMVEVGESQTPGLVSVEFPRCAISRSVIDLLNLLEKILSRIETSSDVCAGRLFCTIKVICRKYTIFVPEHHKKLLQTIPQQIALFYNNCMYIAYKLSTWSDTYLTKLPSLLNFPKNFGEEGRQFHVIATEKFTTYVEAQIQQIHEIMKDAGLDKQTLEQLEPATEKSLRQCLRQQELLRTVWHKVLPYEIYNKTLGTILNALCMDLVAAIVKFEDISTDAAEQLVELFKMVQTRGPKLFTDPKEVSLFVGGWYRMNELAFVLNASLVDIKDRWADGKGPLGLQFKAEELRQLVRALFQNTERRAALLTKIHDTGVCD